MLSTDHQRLLKKYNTSEYTFNKFFRRIKPWVSLRFTLEFQLHPVNCFQTISLKPMIRNLKGLDGLCVSNYIDRVKLMSIDGWENY